MGIKRDPKTSLWSVSYTKRHPVTGKPRSLQRINIKSEKEAKRIYADIVAELSGKLRATVIPSWETALEKYQESTLNRGVSIKTVENAVMCLKAHTLESWGKRPVDSITTTEIRELHAKAVGHRSEGHKGYVLKYIRQTFAYCVESGWIKTNPTPQMRFRPNEAWRFLTESQAQTLLEKAQELKWEWYPHYAAALYTGMRNGELYALRWESVNFERREIHVCRAWDNKVGFKEYTKGRGDRLVSIAPPLLNLLRELKEESEDSDFVLPRIQKWEDGEQASQLRLFLMMNGLPQVRFHDLRASWVTILLNHGVALAKVMQMGGWKDLKTMRKYLRMAGIEIQGATDCLNFESAPKKEVAGTDSVAQGW